jgi:phosphoribosylanthranilate isomerase
MNERIRELAEQANFQLVQYWGKEDRDSLEKFTELILQDIDKIVDDLYHSMPLEQAAVLLTLDENIKEHFYGVEE